MKGGKQPHGFTIVEVMLFLAISSVLFIVAINDLSGKQDQTAFSSSINQITSQLQSVIGNVANGYYTSSQNFKCTGGSGPSGRPKVVSGVGVSRGTNLGCVFIGEAIQFYTASNSSSHNQTFVTYPVVGNQYNETLSATPPVEATNLQQALPVALFADGTDSTVNEYQSTRMPYGIGVASLSYSDTNATAGNPVAFGTIGFFTTFNGYIGGATTSSTLQSGSQAVQIVPIPGSALSDSQRTAANLIDNISGETAQTVTGISGMTSVVNPNQGVEICFDSGTDQESALITIGGINSPTSVNVVNFDQKGCVNA